MRDTADAVLEDVVMARAGDAQDWVSQHLSTLRSGATERDLHIFLGMAPRKLGKADLEPTEDEKARAHGAYADWSIEGWSLDGAARVLGLLAYKSRRPFAETFKDLRRTADAAEIIALYRGLPVYPEPDTLAFEVGEGLRSHMRPVFEAIAHHNPYPRDHFDDHRWNHMVLKALFIDSTLGPITGLRARANRELAVILVNTALERHAAGRAITPELWIPVAPFKDDPEIAAMIERLGDDVPAI